MQIDITVRGPAGDHDVRVTLPPDGTLPASVAESLRTLAGAERLPAGPLRPGRLLESDDGRADTAHGSDGLLELHVVGGAGAGRVVALRRGVEIVGRDPGCDIVLDDDAVSRRHTALAVARGAGGAQVVVRDLQSTNGTLVDGVPVGADAPLPPGAALRIGDTLLALPAADDPPPPAPTVVERHVAPPAERPGRVQWVTALLPAVAGVAVAVALGSPQFLLFALLSPVMVLSGALGDRAHWRRARRRAAVAARADDTRVTVAVAEGLARERSRRRHDAPDPVALARAARTGAAPLWDRPRTSPAFLTARLGTADLPAQLAVRDVEGGDASAGVLAAVPLTVRLADGPLALVGPRGTALAVARWVVAQALVRSPPDEVELVLLVDDVTERDWRWCRWAPHLRSAPASGVPGRARALDALARASAGPAPLVVADLVRAADLAALDLPAAAIVMAAPDRAPLGCAATLLLGSGARATLTRGGRADVELLADCVAPSWADGLARSLAARAFSTAGGTGGTGGDVLALADTDPVVAAATAGDTAAVLAGWHDHGDGADRAEAVLGVTDGEPYVLDLAADGPHALVAGTTGSGKSELLRTLVVGLAVRQPPEALVFLLVDFKGGAAFAGCTGLPHVAGVLTDLDAGVTGRALRALQAELRRRETVFAAAGVADLAGLRRAGGAGTAPVPRLVVVVDEFAELAVQLPDVLAGLVAVARRGRSLGVHLVLATQRPGTAVSSEIRANTAIRIALRTAEPGESSDVIGTDDAARLDPRQPGLALVRAAAGPVRVRTALAGAPAARPGVAPLDGWRRPLAGTAVASDLDPLVATIALAAGQRPAAPRPPWPPPLPRAVPLSSLPARHDSGSGGGADGMLAIGLLDLPDQLRQPALTIGPHGGVLIVGRAGSGRTTALLTVLAAALGRPSAGPPRVPHVHVVGGDLAVAAAPLAHGTVIGDADLDVLPALLHRLARRGRRRDGATTLLLLDDWDRTLPALPDADAVAAATLLTDVVRAASRTATLVVASGGRDLLGARVGGGFETRLLLDLAHRDDYLAAGLGRDLPARFPPGGGVRVADGSMFQLAHPGAVADAPAASVVARLAEQTPPPHDALRLRPLPARIALDDLPPARAASLRLGPAGDLGTCLDLDLVATGGRLLVSGPPRSGRTTALRVLLLEAVRADIPVRVLAPPRSPLLATALRLARRGHEVRTVLAGDTRPPPGCLLLVDDAVAAAESDAGQALVEHLQDTTDGRAAVVAVARSDEVLADYQGLVATVRRERCAVLLRPGPGDGEPFGVRTAERAVTLPPGRALLIGDPRWHPLLASPVHVQIADPGAAD
ncbi:FtsK/SpoIIIE domain-containing protein [Jatrophihabitans fulvus]